MRRTMLKGLLAIVMAFGFLSASVDASAWYYNNGYYHRGYYNHGWRHYNGYRYHCWVVSGHRDRFGYWVAPYRVCR